MSWERLEIIKSRNYFFTHMTETTLKEDWDWLIKQVDRVRELELEKATLLVAHKELSGELNRIKRLYEQLSAEQNIAL